MAVANDNDEGFWRVFGPEDVLIIDEGRNRVFFNYHGMEFHFWEDPKMTGMNVGRAELADPSAGRKRNCTKACHGRGSGVCIGNFFSRADAPANPPLPLL